MKMKGKNKTEEVENAASNYLQSIKKGIMSENRFSVDQRFNDYLDRMIEEYKESINSGKTFYRARIYEEPDVYEKWRNGVPSSELFKGYSEKDSGPNPNPMRPGRCNPKGISYLYAATDPDTAILEVCNKRNAVVSVAKIMITKEITAVNLANDIIFGKGACHSYEEFKQFELEMAVRAQIATEMNRTFFDEGEYLLTQYICEYIKKKGVDCVLYQSASHAGDDFEPREGSSAGNNIVIFNREVYDVIGSDLYLINNIQIKKTEFKNELQQKE